MEILGYILAVFVGLSSGLIGAGGSIIALPILVYLFGVEAAETAPTYSLFVVGLSSFMGAVLKKKQGLVNFKMVVIFGVPTVISIFITRFFIVPMIPEIITSIGSFVITKRLLVMCLFACLMILTSYFMIRKHEHDAPLTINHLFSFIAGLITGFSSGLVGVGGGFIMVPALIKVGNLTMKTAIGTSLAIISLNAAVGFVASSNHVFINWQLLLIFSVLAIGGMVIGNYYSNRVKSGILKKGFGWFILLTGIFIIVKEIIIKK